MKKNNIYIQFSNVLLALLILILPSCKKDLANINVNPNAPESADPQFLLSNIIYQAAKNNAEEGWKNGNLLAQHTSNLTYFPIDRYDVETNAYLWDADYRLLNDIHSIETSATTNDGYKGIALIMKSQLASQLTDLWGDVPYFQAVKGSDAGIFSPVYDKQQDIYTAPNGILDNLDKAVSILSSSKDIVNGDILYKGDLSQWIRFANSLKVRYLIRISKKIDVSSKLQGIISQNLIFRSNNDNAVVPFLASAPNQWYLINEREGRYEDVRMSKTSENILVPLNDARLNVYFKPTAASIALGTPAYKGLPNGLNNQSQNSYDLNDISLIGKLFRDDPQGVNAPLMTYAELQFLLAEAAQKGYIQGKTQTYYEEGIIASHDYFHISLSANYLTSSGVSLNGSDDLKKIITQKWISNFLNGYEAWFDIRRTGFPILPIPKDNLNGNVYPVRFRYPTSEQAANLKNYQDAVSRMGADDYNTKGWWEK